MNDNTEKQAIDFNTQPENMVNSVEDNQLDKRKQELSAMRKNLLEKRLRGQVASKLAPLVLESNLTGIEALSLSLQQRRIWFFEQINPLSATYNIPLRLRLVGIIYTPILKQAFEEVIKRHEILRTSFRAQDGQPYRVVYSEAKIEWHLSDLEHLTEAEQETAIDIAATKNAQFPFDLNNGPLIRVRVLKLAVDKHIILLTLHHLVADGWSVNIFLKESSIIYKNLLNKLPPNLPKLALQYGDFATWQQQVNQIKKFQKQAKYWVKQLAEPRASLELPGKQLRPAVQNFKGSTLTVEYPISLLQALKKITSQEKTTLFMTLLTSYGILLYHYTKQTDISIGSPITNRSQAELLNLIGCFINTIVFRLDLEGSPNFLEMLARVRQLCLDAYANQDIPFEEVVELLQPERSLSYNPIFQTMFSLQNDLPGNIEFGDVDLAFEYTETGTSKFDLTLTILKDDYNFVGLWKYNADLFEPTTIKKMSNHFRVVLERIVQNPTLPIQRLDLLTKQELGQLEKWNNTSYLFDTTKNVGQLFEEQANLHPTRIAVQFKTETLTYSRLNSLANSLARKLRELGVKPEIPVILCLERSLDLVIGVIAILKAGGAYIPLNPLTPVDRITYIVSDTQASLILTRKEYLPLFENYPLNRILIIDNLLDTDDIADNNLNLNPQASAQNLAYILYTSGSTGRPKGVAVEHGQLINYISAIRMRLDLDKCSNFAMIQPFTFDSSITVFYPPLLSGACLHIIAEDTTTNPALLAQYFKSNAVDCLKITPSHLEALLDYTQPEQVLPAKKLIIGGESSKLDWLQKIQQLKPNSTIFNHYGPTETTVGVLVFNLNQTDNTANFVSTPLGQPLANTQIYLLDAYFQRTPLGIPGELYISGKNLARGYYNNPASTAASFLPNPFSREAGERLYKTGDLACYLAGDEGNLEFLGRLDHQVKIRGFRIELGEIETILNQHPEVAQAVVLARDVHSSKSLIAYIVTKLKKEFDATEIENYLKLSLPEYMIPSYYVFLTALPLSSHGKLDINKLPNPELLEQVSKEVILPRSKIEKTIHDTWCGVLELDVIGVHDNFFKLGGHSLIATRIISRLRDLFQIDIPLRLIFEFPTIENFSSQIEKLLLLNTTSNDVPLQPADHDNELELSFAQYRQWLLQQLEPESRAYNVPISLHLKGPLNSAALEQSLNYIINRHAVLRTVFRISKGRPIQLVEVAEYQPLPIIDLSGLTSNLRETELLKLEQEGSQYKFDLEQSPLIRFKLVILGKLEALLLIIVHHIAWDADSRKIFVRELKESYTSFTQAKAIQLDALKIQYADFAMWQRKNLTGEILKAQIEYWKNHLKSPLPQLELVTDFPRPIIQTHKGAIERASLPLNLANQLRELANQNNLTLFMVFLAGFEALLYRYTNQTDLVIGIPISNRSKQEFEPLIGFFMNTLAIRVQFEPTTNFLTLLQEIRAKVLEGYSHQEFPFEQLVEELKPPRSLDRHPLFQVIFSFQKAELSEETHAGLNFGFYNTKTYTSKFDLSLAVIETSESLITSFEYNTDLFKQPTIKRMLVHYQELLKSAVVQPTKKLAELSLLPKAEQTKLLSWGQLQAGYNQPGLKDLFESQTNKTPNVPAIIFEQKALTYNELNIAANQLAVYLQKVGVRREVPVAVCLESSFNLIIAILGILKAGGIWVPLDPTYPQERIALMLTDSKAGVILTQQKLEKILPTTLIPTLVLDYFDYKAMSESGENLPTEIWPEQLAYIIYTSGSTGKPKGVQLPQGSLQNLISWQIQAHKYRKFKTLQFAAAGFDVFFQEIFSTLCSGGTLYLIELELKRDTTQLVQFLIENEIERIFLPFIALQKLAQAACEKGIFPIQLAQVITAGEQLQITAPIKEFFLHLTHCSLTNQYGPTESHVISSYSLKKETSINWPLLPSIGCAIDNTEIYVLDDYGQLAPIGIAGELYLGGNGLARGYLNKPATTAERFIPHPFSSVPGARLYRSGDMGRYLEDGTLEFLGRRDNQIKYRGYRIELEEIEVTLNQHPVVQENAIALMGSNEEKRLVAYIVFKENSQYKLNELQTFLRKCLPEYMIPGTFYQVSALPLTATGKINRRSLATIPHTQIIQPSAGNSNNLSTLELALLKIWCEVLELPSINLEDNFFELGGHSLLAIKLISQVALLIEREVSVNLLFLHPTFSAFANTLGVNKRETVSYDKLANRDIEKKVTILNNQPSSFLYLEQRSLLSLLSIGKLAPVQAVAINYLPSYFLYLTNLKKENFIAQWCDNLPVIGRIRETFLGRIASITLPIFDVDIYTNQETLVGLVMEALELAQRIGAKTAALTGLLPSATNYGNAIETFRQEKPYLPIITTGHNTTVAAMNFSITRILQESSRLITKECLGVLGLGSIGWGTLCFLLETSAHPKSLILCDVYNKQEYLESLKQQIIEKYNFQGNIQILSSRGEIPSEFYASTLIVGATNAPDILDVNRLAPGTLVVDDSAPACFSIAKAIERLEKYSDILFTNGGKLKMSQNIKEIRYVSSFMNQILPLEIINQASESVITSCALSSLLYLHDENLQPTIGTLSTKSSLTHYQALIKLGFEAVPLQCESYTIEENLIYKFRQQFG